MLDHLRPGMRIRARGPAGIFTIPMRGDAKYLFISAGTGITPSLSMTNYLYDRGLGTDVVLVNCVRRPAEIICRRRLELMVSRVPSIKLHFIVEQEDPYDVWTGYRGRLNQLMLGLIASDYLERKVYCCGPEPFMQAVRDMLIALGYDMEHYHQESFALAVETEADAPELDDFVPDEAKSAEIVFAEFGRDGGLQRDRDRAGGRQGRGAQHPERLQLRRLRHLQDPEALRRGPHGPQRRHLHRRHRGRLHPRLLLASDRTHRGRGLM